MSYRQLGLLLPCLLFASQLAAQAMPGMPSASPPSFNYAPSTSLNMGFPPTLGAGGPSVFRPFGLTFAERHLSRAVAALQKAYVLERSSGADPSRIHKLYWDAREELDAARTHIQGDSVMLAAVYNDVAYAESRLGHPQAALDAADSALNLAPTLTKALENRGEALVALSRTEEAKQVYLTLFPQYPRLASVLLAYMQNWIDTKRKTTETPQGSLDAFQEWVRMQAQIAASGADGA
jgi:tetratricopeptide (TPR) repeat protein